METITLSAYQAKAVGDWAVANIDHPARVELRMAPAGILRVRQGDASATFLSDGSCTSHIGDGLDHGGPEEDAKERATCSRCLARTYRSNEDCVCEDGGDAESYENVRSKLSAQESDHHG